MPRRTADDSPPSWCGDDDYDATAVPVEVRIEQVFADREHPLVDLPVITAPAKREWLRQRQRANRILDEAERQARDD